MVRRAALLATTLAGCNWVLELDPPRPAVDATPLDAPLGPWGPPTAIPSLAKVGIGEQDPCPSPNGLELYTMLQDPAGTTGVDIRVSVRPADGEWPAPQMVTTLNTASDDSTPRVSLDGLTIYLSTNRAAPTSDVWAATRDALDLPWNPPEVLTDPEVNTTAEDRTLTECAGGRRVFASDRLGSNDLFEEAGGIARPIPVASNAAVIESTPFISADCLTLYFSSLVTGTYELYVATRATVDVDFDTAARIEELVLPDRHVSDPWVSADGHHMMFSVASTAAPADSDIYESYR